MKVELKYNIGDKVWFMYKNKPCCGKICEITYCKNMSTVDFDTIFENVGITVTDENDCKIGFINSVFDTKQELIESL